MLGGENFAEPSRLLFIAVLPFDLFHPFGREGRENFAERQGVCRPVSVEQGRVIGMRLALVACHVREIALVVGDEREAQFVACFL